jgi:hypothetical protein
VASFRLEDTDIEFKFLMKAFSQLLSRTTCRPARTSPQVRRK